LINISENRKNILTRIKIAHDHSNYSEQKSPILVAVSKKQLDYKIDLALGCGQRHFGENRVQEASNRWAEKLDRYKDLQLRLIGPLQTNKVKQALQLFDVIETIDREKLANEISSKINRDSKTQSLYIQINTGCEQQKSGIQPRYADEFINFCIISLKLPVVGLMCIPPLNEEPCIHFALLKKIADRNNLKELSMGMSGDFEEAIKFGATSVRVGSLIFGDREKDL